MEQQRYTCYKNNGSTPFYLETEDILGLMERALPEWRRGAEFLVVDNQTRKTFYLFRGQDPDGGQ